MKKSRFNSIKYRRKTTNRYRKISHNQAIEKARTEYKKYQVKTITPVEEAYLRTIKELNNKASNKNS